MRLHRFDLVAFQDGSNQYEYIYLQKRRLLSTYL